LASYRVLEGETETGWSLALEGYEMPYSAWLDALAEAERAGEPGEEWRWRILREPSRELPGTWTALSRYPPEWSVMDAQTGEPRVARYGTMPAGLSAERFGILDGEVKRVVVRLLPALGDPTDYRWDEVRNALLLALVSAGGWILSDDELDSVTRALYRFVHFVCDTLAAKWVVGLRACANDPDPYDLRYPQTDPEWRAWQSWASIEDDVQQHHPDATFEQFWEQNKGTYPPAGAFSSLGQILEHEVGPDWDTVDYDLPAEFVAFHRQHNPQWITQDGGLWWGRSAAETCLTQVFVETYGWPTLTADFEDAAELLIKNARLLGRVHEHGQSERYGPIFEEFRATERALREWAYGPIFEEFRATERALRDWARQTLKMAYPDEKAWWTEGVPAEVRRDCAARREDDPGRHDALEYVYFIELKKIFTYRGNWKRFGATLEAISDAQGKEKATAFLDELNAARNTLGHSRPLSDRERQTILYWARRVRDFLAPS
jgi:hypothetical protein